ncbi:hypothetical protein LJC27_02525 [Christensenellaceae bacterium OttesenSCG-928-M15]|nr:hypothetical protein [Christensenellaceae bacterium OttesenSCG-928-M15]
MAKFKISYKMLQEQVGEIEEINKLVLSQAETMQDISGKLGSDASLQAMQKSIKDGANKLQEFSRGMKAIASTMSLVIEKYTSTENNNSKKVDSARAHNRDFYKNAVSVPSASVGARTGGASASATMNVNIADAAASPETVGATSGGSSFVNETVPVASSAAAPVAAAASSRPVSASIPTSGTSPASGINAGVVAGAAAVGAAAVGGAVAAGIKNSKKKKREREEAELNDTYDELDAFDTPAMQELEAAERQLEEAMKNAGKLQQETV